MTNDDFVSPRGRAVGLLVVVTLTSAAAQIPLMSAINFLVDYRTLIGREVNAGPCQIAQADAFCRAYNPAGAIV